MTTLETIKLIRADGLSALDSRFGILARRHGRFPNLVQLKYSQRESPMDEPVVQECRGLILDEANDWDVVAFPFTKFFNYGEPLAHAIDWETARVYEKLDGSLMTVYPYRGQWQVASSALPDAGGSAGATFKGSFAELFWQVWASLGYAAPRLDDGRACYMFELMTAHNRVVCRQTQSRVVLIGARHLDTFVEWEPDPVAARYGWESARSFPLRTVDDCTAAACSIDPMQGEGFVVRDASFRRVKIKSPRYVALAHLKEGLSGRRMLEIVRANEAAEVLAHFPELTPFHDKIRGAYDTLCGAADTAYREIQHIAERKAFAASAIRTPFAAALFALRDAKAATARDFFATCTLPALERVIGINLDEAADAGAATQAQ
jgi:hypothetical protein